LKFAASWFSEWVDQGSFGHSDGASLVGFCIHDEGRWKSTGRMSEKGIAKQLNDTMVQNSHLASLLSIY